LEKWKDAKLPELEADLLDDEYLFDGSQLTEKERRDRQFKKKTLSLAEQHQKAGEFEKAQRYIMPKDVKVRSKTIPDKYVEVDEREKHPHSERRVWEDDRMAAAQWRFGARNAKQLKEESERTEYNLLLADEIKFVQMTCLEGTKVVPEKKQSLQETLKSLPVYPFRDDLIKAKNQALIIEGETGSDKTRRNENRMHAAPACGGHERSRTCCAGNEHQVGQRSGLL
jgi:pre-mRNA-splicing factor ATP-dependent RNA helicase DHX16